jgi:hypothetical protein
MMRLSVHYILTVFDSRWKLSGSADTTNLEDALQTVWSGWTLVFVGFPSLPRP